MTDAALAAECAVARHWHLNFNEQTWWFVHHGMSELPIPILCDIAILRSHFLTSGPAVALASGAADHLRFALAGCAKELPSTKQGDIERGRIDCLLALLDYTVTYTRRCADGRAT